MYKENSMPFITQVRCYNILFSSLILFVDVHNLLGSNIHTWFFVSFLFRLKDHFDGLKWKSGRKNVWAEAWLIVKCHFVKVKLSSFPPTHGTWVFFPRCWCCCFRRRVQPFQCIIIQGCVSHLLLSGIRWH